MPTREPNRHYSWRSFNPIYGPWYRLVQSSGKTISGAEVVVQPDMDNSRWFWFVRIGKKDVPRELRSGHEPTKEEAQRVARATFEQLY